MKDISLSFIETHKLILLIRNIQMYKWTNETNMLELKINGMLNFKMLTYF